LGFWERWFYGSIGAASPEVVRWYSLAKQPTAPDLPYNLLLYGIGTLVFVIFGGIFATLWPDENKLRCFYLGVTFPTVVSAIVASAFKP